VLLKGGDLRSPHGDCPWPKVLLVFKLPPFSKLSDRAVDCSSLPRLTSRGHGFVLPFCPPKEAKPPETSLSESTPSNTWRESNQGVEQAALDTQGTETNQQ